MKYENFKQVKSLVEQIEKHERHYNELTTYPNVEIMYASGTGRIYTIGNGEHEYNKQAQELIEFIKTDLTNRIANLKSQLELL